MTESPSNLRKKVEEKGSEQDFGKQNLMVWNYGQHAVVNKIRLRYCHLSSYLISNGESTS